MHRLRWPHSGIRSQRKTQYFLADKRIAAKTSAGNLYLKSRKTQSKIKQKSLTYRFLSRIFVLM
jgi:hypothetical protein